MKIISELFVSAALSALLLCSCETKTPSSSESSSEPAAEQMTEETAASQTESSAEPATAPSLPDHSDLSPAEGNYVYDDAGVFSQEDIAKVNSYVELLYENYLINAAVVTTSDLGGAVPYDYAANVYSEVYEGQGSGMLLLINNDTGVDYLYLTGRCLSAIDQKEEAQAYFWATKELVARDYVTAALRMMQLGESCPQHLFDNAGLFSEEDSEALESVLSALEKEVSVLATTNSTGSTNQEICRSYCERRYKDVSGIMIMLDGESKTAVAEPEEALPEGFDKVLTQAGKSLLEGDNRKAAEIIIAALEG